MVILSWLSFKKSTHIEIYFDKSPNDLIDPQWTS